MKKRCNVTLSIKSPAIDYYCVIVCNHYRLSVCSTKFRINLCEISSEFCASSGS